MEGEQGADLPSADNSLHQLRSVGEKRFAVADRKRDHSVGIDRVTRVVSGGPHAASGTERVGDVCAARWTLNRNHYRWRETRCN